jgi:hypothetical protein
MKQTRVAPACIPQAKDEHETGCSESRQINGVQPPAPSGVIKDRS